MGARGAGESEGLEEAGLRTVKVQAAVAMVMGADSTLTAPRQPASVDNALMEGAAFSRGVPTTTTMGPGGWAVNSPRPLKLVSCGMKFISKEPGEHRRPENDVVKSTKAVPRSIRPVFAEGLH